MVNSAPVFTVTSPATVIPPYNVESDEIVPVIENCGKAKAPISERVLYSSSGVGAPALIQGEFGFKVRPERKYSEIYG